MSSKRQSIRHNASWLEKRMFLEQCLIESITDEKGPQEEMIRVIETVCEQLQLSCGTYWEYREDELICLAAAGADRPPVLNYMNNLRNTRLATQTKGLIQECWRESKGVWVENLASDKKLSDKDTFSCGLCSGFSVPVSSHRKQFGVLAFYDKETREVDKDLLQNMEIIGERLGFFHSHSQLEEQLLRFRAAVDVSTDPIYITDRETMRFVDVNETAARLTGYAREELLKLGPHDISHEPRNELEKLYDEVISTGESGHSTEAVRFDKDGTTHFVEHRRRALNVNGRCLIITISQDITARKCAEKNLQRFYAAVNISGDPIYITDRESMRFVDMNDTAVRMSGYSKEELLKLGPQDIAHQSKKELEDMFDQVIAAGDKGLTTESSRFSKNDEMRIVEHRRQAISMDGRWHIVTISHDITERKNAELTMQRLERMFAALSATNEAIIHTKSKNELFEKVCKAAVTSSGFQASTIYMLGDNDGTLNLVAISGEKKSPIRDNSISLSKLDSEKYGLLAIAMDTGKAVISDDLSSDKRLRRWYKSVKQKDLIGAAAVPLLRGDKITGILALYSTEPGIFDDDIVQLLERMTKNIVFALENFERAEKSLRDQERIQFLATHDALTGLPSRIMFNELVNQAIAECHRYNKKFCIMFIDLDRFKQINDTLGHQAGDILLQEISKRLSTSLRSSDIVARIGGDEFVALLQGDVNPDAVIPLTKRILTAVMKPVNIFNQDCRVTSSIGIATYPDHGSDAETIMKNADNAMYCSKDAGKNNAQFYSEAIVNNMVERSSIESYLQQALKNEEFSLHYQARRNLSSGEINGVESLLRWHSPELGEVSPQQLIAVAEDTGLIIPIGRWVLKTACAQNIAWQNDGLSPVCISVNITTKQLFDPNFIDYIQEALSESGMSPDLLELEITETALMYRANETVELLTKIKELGVSIAIDNFGTGYSSLAQLKRLPINVLKVDRSFIKDLPNNSYDQSVTNAIISMGKNLSLTIIAEGVETQQQEQYLRSHACDDIQGYYFSKPISAEKFAALLRAPTQK